MAKVQQQQKTTRFKYRYNLQLLNSGLISVIGSLHLSGCSNFDAINSLRGSFGGNQAKFKMYIYFTLNSTPKQSAEPEAESDDLSTADSIGVGYYVPTYSSYYSPSYYGGYGYGGYGGYGYGGYRSYGRYYRRPIYPVWG